LLLCRFHKNASCEVLKVADLAEEFNINIFKLSAVHWMIKNEYEYASETPNIHIEKNIYKINTFKCIQHVALSISLRMALNIKKMCLM